MPGESFSLNFVVNGSGPTVTTNPSQCNIVSGSGTSCQLIFNANTQGMTSGTYLVTANFIMNESLNSSLPYPATFIVSGNPVPVNGVLSIMPFTQPGVVVGESTTAVVSLSGSSNVTVPVIVNITNNNPGTISESPASCSLTTQNNSCTVTLHGLESGTATFTASANNYSSVTSESLIVSNLPVIIITTSGYTSGESLIQSQSLTILAILGDYTESTESVSVTNSDILSGFGIIVTSIPSPCNMQSGVNESCSFSVTPLWNTAITGGYQVLLTSSGMLSESVIDLITYSPAIYLPQTGESATVDVYTVPPGGDGNPAIGLAWPNPRFTVGSGIESNCITDNLTGLEWVANAGTFAKLTWNDALVAVESMNSNPSATAYNLCGHADWRLPNLNELSSLINDGYTDGSGSYQYTWLQSQGFTNFKTNNFYWSSSINASDPTKSWYINLNQGTTGRSPQTALRFILPVRSVQQ